MLVNISYELLLILDLPDMTAGIGEGGGVRPPRADLSQGTICITLIFRLKDKPLVAIRVFKSDEGTPGCMHNLMDCL
jgi:hypothetical protein